MNKTKHQNIKILIFFLFTEIAEREKNIKQIKKQKILIWGSFINHGRYLQMKIH